MAEVLGVVASGISVVSFALQLAENIKKLKEFVDNVRDAPEDIKHTIHELETLNLQLADVEKELQQNPITTMNNSSLQQCVANCKKGTTTLDLIVRDLDKEIGRRRKRASIRAWFKKDTLDKYARRLESAKSSLMFSYLIYSNNAQTKLIVDMQKTILTPANTPINNTTTIITTTTTSTDITPRPRSTQKAQAGKLYKIDALAWLIGKAWHIQFEGSSNNWGLRFQTYDVLPDDHQIFQYCRQGDLDGVKHMFMSGQASPFCKTEWGYTLLHLVTIWGESTDIDLSLQLCQFLIDQGSDTSVVVNESSQHSPAACLSALHIVPNSNWYSRALDLYRTLLDGIEPFSDLLNYDNNPVVDCELSSEAILLSHEKVWPPVQTRPILERLLYALRPLRVCVSDGYAYRPLDVKMFETRLCGKLLEDSVLETAFGLDRELGFFATMMQCHGKSQWRLEDSSVSVTSDVLAAAIQRNVNLHDCRVEHPDFARRDRSALFLAPTALTNFVQGWMLRSTMFNDELDLRTCQDMINESLDHWLSHIGKLGIDPEDFIKKEAAVLRRYSKSRFTWNFMAIHYHCDHFGYPKNGCWSVRVEGLVQAPSTDLWELRISWPPQYGDAVPDLYYDFYETNFLEAPAAMPGGWDDDGKRSGEDSDGYSDEDSDEDIYEDSDEETDAPEQTGSSKSGSEA